MLTWFAGLALGLTLAPAGDGEAWRLRWDAPAECPTADEVRATIERTIGDAPVTSELVAEGTVTRSDDARWRLTLRVSGGSGSGTRTLAAADCGELADAGALVVAIALASELAVAEVPVAEVPPESESEPSPDPKPEPTARPDLEAPLDEGDVPPASGAENAPREDIEEKPPAPRVRGYARAGAGVGLGILPSVAAVTFAEAGAFGRFWRAGLGFAFWLPRSASAPDNPAVGGSFSLWSLQPRGCGVPEVGAVSFPLCLGASLGAVRGTGTGALAISETASAFWSAAAGSAGVAWSSRVVGVWIELSALAALNRPAFRTVQTPLVFESGAFGGQIAGGIELRFP